VSIERAPAAALAAVADALSLLDNPEATAHGPGVLPGRRDMKARFLVHLAVLVMALLGVILLPLVDRRDALAAAATNLDPWPRHMQISGGSLTVYQPQVDSWDGGFLKFRAAVSVTPSGGGQEIFGIIRASAHTLVDRTTRMVTLFNYSLLQIDFPSLPDHGQRYYADLGKLLPSATTKISLDRLQGFLAVTNLTAKTVDQVKNEPPHIIISYKPAVLVPISGAPVFRPIPDSSLQRVINTRALIISGGGEVFLHVYDGWMAAPGLEGPWHVATGVSPTLDQIADRLARQDAVDLLRGNAKTRPSLGTSPPSVYIAYKPTELVVFQGQPQFTPITNTQLLWATNSLNDVIINTANNDYYVLISGRWFRGPGLGGPWTYVNSKDLPPDFRRIPAGVPAAEVLASVAGTSQAKEALIADSIPQTAVIPRKGGPSFTPVFDGAPQFRPIEGTPLQYVVNSPDPIIEVGPTAFYALRRGVWFTSSTVLGPWSVATFVPDVIYSIPASSPLHYVTYVQIYWASPESVEVGYTPGYVGTVVEPDGVVVYGTGYDYPAWIGTDYYPPPPTYGVAVYPAYDPYAEAAFGFAMGMMTEALLAPAPYWGPVYYNDYYYNDYWHGGCCYNTGYDNFYGHYGNTTYNGYHDYGYNPYTGNSGGTSNFHTYNSATGTSSEVHSYSGYNAYTGARGGGYNRSFYNNKTGISGDVDRNAAYNPETGNFERAGGGNAYNPNTGSSAEVQHASGGNVYKGTSAGETTATVTNGRTGQTNTYGVGHNGNDVYAGSDGNVYRNNGSGWQENSGGGWHNTDSSFNSSYVNQESQARSWGDNRYSSFDNRGFFGGGGFNGTYRGGGFGGWSGGRFGGGGGGFGGGFHRFGGRW